MHEKYFPDLTRNTIFAAFLILIAKPIVGLMIQAFPVKPIPALVVAVTSHTFMFAFFNAFGCHD